MTNLTVQIVPYRTIWDRDQIMSTQERLLRLKSVVEITGISKTEIYRRLAKNSFPKPGRIGPRIVIWRESEIKMWMFKQFDPDIASLL